MKPTEIIFPGYKITIYKNPKSGQFRWQISSMAEFESSNGAAENLDHVLNLPRSKPKKWVWDLYWKKWRCPACGKKISKSYPHCPYCGVKLEKGE